MATETLTYSTTLDVISCGTCEIPFALPSSLHRSVRDTGESFWCPNGHKVSYHQTEADRLRADLKRAREQRDWAESARDAARDQADAAERSAAAYKGVTTRLKNRAAAGVCPCCHRSFRALRDHMASKHPGFAEEDTAEAAASKRRARCPGCHADILVNADGLLRRHNYSSGNACNGSREPAPGSTR